MDKKMIYKQQMTSNNLNVFVGVKGVPRTLCIDGDGALAMYYESSDEVTCEAMILWTGDPIPENSRVVDSINYKGLVYHLVVKNSKESASPLIARYKELRQALGLDVDEFDEDGDECPNCGRVLGTSDGKPSCNNCGPVSQMVVE